jgi:hypothetical protein
MLVLLPLGACASPGRRVPVTVAVRDGVTRQPIEGARVLIRSVHFFLPYYPFEIVDSVPPMRAAGITDAAGLVRLVTWEHAPVQVIVEAIGRPPLVVHVDGAPASDTGWRSGDAAPGGADAGAAIEVQFRP